MVRQRRFLRVERIIVKAVSEGSETVLGTKDREEVIRAASRVFQARIRRMITKLLNDPRLVNSRLDDVRLRLLDIHDKLYGAGGFNDLKSMLDHFDEVFRLVEEVRTLLEEGSPEPEVLRLVKSIQKLLRGG